MTATSLLTLADSETARVASWSFEDRLVWMARPVNAQYNLRLIEEAVESPRTSTAIGATGWNYRRVSPIREPRHDSLILLLIICDSALINPSWLVIIVGSRHHMTGEYRHARFGDFGSREKFHRRTEGGGKEGHFSRVKRQQWSATLIRDRALWWRATHRSLIATHSRRIRSGIESNPARRERQTAMRVGATRRRSLRWRWRWRRRWGRTSGRQKRWRSHFPTDWNSIPPFLIAGEPNPREPWNDS